MYRARLSSSLLDVADSGADLDLDVSNDRGDDRGGAVVLGDVGWEERVSTSDPYNAGETTYSEHRR